MALIITTQPTYTFEPIYNYFNFKIQSSASTNPKYEFIADIYINSVFITRFKKAPAPDGYGYFDLAKAIESYVSFDTTSLLDFSSNPGQALPNSYVNTLVVKFGERYGLDIPTNYLDLATSSTYYPFNGALNYLDRSSFVGTDYLMNGTGTPKFLTNATRELRITKEQNFWLTFLRNDLLVGTGDKFRLRSYGSDGTFYFEWYIDYNIDTLDNGGRMIRIPASLALWQQINPSFVTGGDWGDLTATENAYYDISIYNEDLDTAGSETFIIRFKDDICKYTPKEIVFLNRFGAFESFVFQLANFETQTINRTTYTNANPVSQLNYSKTDRRQHSFGVDVQQNFTVVSNWINEDESVWLSELISSPTTFINEGGVLIPINILTTSYEVFKKENRKLFNLKLDYKYTIKNDIQRG